MCGFIQQWLLPKTIGIFLLFQCFFSHTVSAKGFKPFWSASLYLGEHSAALTPISQNVFIAPLTFSNGEVMLDTGETIEKTRKFQNSLPPLEGGSEMGGEFEWIYSPRFSFFAGLSGWESTEVQSVATGRVLVEKREVDAVGTRNAKLSYSQAFLGARFSLLHKPRRYRLYSRLSLNSIFDFDYFEKFVFTFDAADFPKAAGVQEVDSFKRVMITRARATAILALQGGLGFDIFLTNQLALGFEGGYVFAASRFGLTRLEVKHNILDKDGMGQILYPVAANPEDGKGYYLAPDASKYYFLDLDLKGWKAAVTLRFSY